MSDQVSNLNQTSNLGPHMGVARLDATVNTTAPASSFDRPAEFARSHLMAEYERKHSPVTVNNGPAAKETQGETEAARFARYAPANSFHRPREYIQKDLLKKWERSHSPIAELH